MYYITKTVYDEYLKAEKEGKKNLICSLDLGISKTLTTVEQLDKAFSQIKKVSEKDIYLYDGKNVSKPQIFSDALYSLSFDENKVPCLYIDGVKMNTGKEKGVQKYNESVVQNLKLDEEDTVLEICTGLGYKTQMIAKIAKRVTTIEKSKDVIALAKLNPFSRGLFNYKNIKLIDGDAFEKVKKFPEKTFTKILHDPPTFKFAPELYSDEFYLELNRVAKDGARLFHYTGNPGGKFRGKNLISTTEKKIEDAGWRIIKKADKGIYCVND